MKTVKILFFSLAASVFLISCEKDDAVPGENPKVTTGVFVLSEGSFSSASTTITFYDFATKTPATDFYRNANSTSLGTLGNDLLVYGSKMYVVMNVDSYVEVADAKTAKHIKAIPFGTGANALQPRYAVAYKNKVLVSSWDGSVAVIDTTSLSVDKFIRVGANPEQLVVVGDRLYVTNSGGLQVKMDSTVSVVDLISQTELRKITVGVNPGYITADKNGGVYVSTLGNYFDVGPKLVKINTTTNAVIKSTDTAVGKISYHDGLLYATGGYFGSANVRALDTSNFKATRANFVTDGTGVLTPYGLTIDPQNGDVYIADAKNYVSAGEVFCFDKTGKKKFSFSTTPGANPNTIVLTR